MHSAMAGDAIMRGRLAPAIGVRIRLNRWLPYGRARIAGAQPVTCSVD